MFRKSLAAATLAAALMFVPAAANALDCNNVSRPAYTGTEWVFIPDISVPGVPGSGGNYQNGEGFALLVNALCDSAGAGFENRQTEHGIQLMHGCG